MIGVADGLLTHNVKGCIGRSPAYEERRGSPPNGLHVHTARTKGERTRCF